MLSKFPAYDPEIYLQLRSLHQRIKAKIRQSEKKIQLMNFHEPENEQCFKDKQALDDYNNSFNNSNEDLEHYSEDLTSSFPQSNKNSDKYSNHAPYKDSTNYSENTELLGKNQNGYKKECENVNFSHCPQSNLTKKTFYCANNINNANSTNNSPYKTEEKCNANSKLNDSLDSHENSFSEKVSQNNKSSQSSPVQAQRKSKFQLKVPIKATIDPMASKQLEEIIEKNNLSKHNSSGDLNDSFSPKLFPQSQSPVAIKPGKVQSGFEFKNSPSGSNFQSSADSCKSATAGVLSNNFNTMNEKPNQVEKKSCVAEIPMETLLSTMSAFGIYIACFINNTIDFYVNK